MARAPKADPIITVSEIQMTVVNFNIVGMTPLMPHSPSAHAKGQLLFPAPKKNAAERATTMKHEPFVEFREAAYRFSDEEPGPTRLYYPASGIKAAIRDVAIDMIGTKKSQIGRLTTVMGQKLRLYGVPSVNTMLVRSSDINRTPDIRTLPCLERWAIPNISIRFVNSLIKPESIVNLMANAGIIVGIGDGRPQNGYFDYGTWRLCQDDDKELREIMKMGRAAQDKALDDPEYYDLESEQLLTWFLAEKKRRAALPPAQPKTTQPKAKTRGRKKKDWTVPPDVVAALQSKNNGRGTRAKANSK